MCWQVQLPTQNLLHELSELACVEGLVAHEQFVEEAAETPPVDPLVVWLAEQNLRGQVLERRTLHALEITSQRPTLCDVLAHSKVSDL